MLSKCSVFLALAAVCIAAEAPGFKVTKKYPAPGDGGFDYIVFDGSSNRLYVSHGTKVDVLDADSGKVLGSWKTHRACMESPSCPISIAASPATAGIPPYPCLIERVATTLAGRGSM
ncbi:MAG: hypothetical protein WBW33_12790 [Bryobacteraceae bacterium]